MNRGLYNEVVQAGCLVASPVHHRVLPTGSLQLPQPIKLLRPVCLTVLAEVHAADVEFAHEIIGWCRHYPCCWNLTLFLRSLSLETVPEVDIDDTSGPPKLSRPGRFRIDGADRCRAGPVRS